MCVKSQESRVACSAPQMSASQFTFVSIYLDLEIGLVHLGHVTLDIVPLIHPLFLSLTLNFKLHLIKWTNFFFYQQCLLHTCMDAHKSVIILKS